MQSRRERISGIIRRRERSLETMQTLLKLRLIAKRTDLTIHAVYYKICNAILRATIKIL